MHLVTVTSILLATAAGVCQAQATNDDSLYWCGQWAGAPNPADVPQEQQLPVHDSFKRFFVEPQLQRVPFSPVQATEPKVQVPKIWGNNGFRLALLSYRDQRRVYSSSKSRWLDFYAGLKIVMTKCVTQGVGGAALVPPSPGLTQGTLVVYAYEVGSLFDFQMNYYMSTPSAIDPSTLRAHFLAVNGNFTIPLVDPLPALAIDVL